MFRSFFNKEDAVKPEAADALPRPERPLFVIGDLHGRSDLLDAILEEIDAVLGEVSMQDPQLVFVGDYVDRGPDSKEVLEKLHLLCTDYPTNVICLRGNHEQMMLDFLDNPVLRSARWLRSGGLNTFSSMGISLVGADLTPEAAKHAAERLAQSLGAEMVAWLRELPTKMTSGNVTIVHAAADPKKPVDAQSDRVLLWGHPEFLSRTRKDGQWIVHGHTIVDEAEMGDNRISIDTGAYVTDILTAAVILPEGEVEFIQT